MKLFLDTEFTGLHQQTTLVSIGIISEDSRTFYAELTDYDQEQIDEWLQQHVVDNLIFQAPLEGEDEHYAATRHTDNPVGNNLYANYSVEMRGTMEDVRVKLEEWLAQFRKVEIWSDCLAYDWMLFNQIFGHAFKIPKNVYYIPFDICTVFKMQGIDPDISREDFASLPQDEMLKHNSLWDARVIRACYFNLTARLN